jgi:hypothetical protein
MPGPKRLGRITLGTLMLGVWLAALNVLFFRYWINHDREVRARGSPLFVQSMAIYYGVSLVAFPLSALNAAFVLLVACRDDR